MPSRTPPLFSCVASTAWLLLVGCQGCDPDPPPAGETGLVASPSDDTATDSGEGADTAPCESDPAAARGALESHCYACHGAGGVAEGGLNYVLDAQRLVDSLMVVPGDPTGSPLYTQIAESAMPPGDPDFADTDEAAAIHDWIACGAEDLGTEQAARGFIDPETVSQALAADLDGAEVSDPTSVPYIRYVGLVHLYNAGVSDDALETYRFGLAKLLNALSRGPDVTNPAPVALDDLETAADDDDNNDELLFRIDLRDYGWTANDEDPVDGWEHLLKDYPLGFVHDDASYDQLRARTGSRQPLINGDWLVWAAATPPLYHDILRVPETLDDFLDDFGVHRQDDIDALTAQRAGFAESSVALNNRLAERHPADGGYCWIAYDFASSTGEQSIFNHPLDFAHDGTATLCALPNGLNAWFLADASGQRRDQADPALLEDHDAEENLVTNGLSCMRCHPGGPNPATDAVRGYVEGVEDTNQFSSDELETIYALYPGADAISDLIIADASAFQAALAQTGAPEMTTDSTVALVIAFEEPMPLERVAAEVGLEASGLDDRLLSLPSQFDDLKPLTGGEQTVPRSTFLGLARELMCQLDSREAAPNASGSFCPEPGGFGETAVECLDGQALVEAGEDQGACVTCDGGTLQVTWYTDGDGDGYGSGDDVVVSCEPVDDHVDQGDDCDDATEAVNPNAEEDCADPADLNCDGYSGTEDNDGDGFFACEECDDGDPGVNPEATETCDAVDQDCDGAVDEDASDARVWYADADADGYADPEAITWSCARPEGYLDPPPGVWDCDDDDPLVHPETEWYPDADGDGYGDPAGTPAEACEPPSGYTSASAAADCDDADASLNPETLWYADTDADGYGDPNDATVACEQPANTSLEAGDCDDGDADAWPGADEFCDGHDDDCDGDADEPDAIDAATWYADADGDGYGDETATTTACADSSGEGPTGYVADDSATGGWDCDDTDSDDHPGADELCTPAGGASADEDCDGAVDEDGALDALTWYADADSDGYGDALAPLVACEDPDGEGPSGFVADATDCDDGVADVSPLGGELCDEIDNDCDGIVDEDGALDAATWYADADNDGYGDPNASAAACERPDGYADADATDTIDLYGDCDDGDAAVNVDGDEVCDGVDNDCDGDADESGASDATNWHIDFDGDGYGASHAAYDVVSCDPPAGYLPASAEADCDDTDADAHPSAPEVCGDGVDQDCDGADEIEATYYADSDGDGYGAEGSGLTSCGQPSGYVADDGGADCDDADPDAYPDAPEVCGDPEDYDCDGALIGPPVWYEDNDGDGYGSTELGDQVFSCDDPGGVYVDTPFDCDDGDATINLDGTEICDGADNDCDSTVDESVAACGEIELSDVGVKLIGESTNDDVGWAVAIAGDVDDDGLDDLLIGARYESDGYGAAYLVLGGVTSTLDLSDADAKLTGENATDYAGQTVAGAGDVNDDGYADLLIGAPAESSGDPGAAYLVHGPLSGTHSLSSADARLIGEGADDQAGRAIAGAGDVDGDGADDVIVGASYANYSSNIPGIAYLVSGPVSGDLNLADADARLIGQATYDFVGQSVAGPGDVDGDGLRDLLIGAYGLDGAYLVQGPVSGDVSLADADVILSGAWNGGSAGWSVSAAGDVDGDGKRDLLIGDPYADIDEDDAGAAYLVLGGVSLDTTLASADAVLAGEAAYDHAGYAVAGAGDFDDDGFDDLLVGAYSDETNGSSSGATYLILGPVTGSLDLSAADAKWLGGSGHYAGFSVSGGDVDADGYSDVLIGAPRDGSGGVAAGAAWLIFGAP